LRTFHSVGARWFEAAFVPGELDGGFVAACPKLVGVKSGGRSNVFVHRADSRSLDAQRLAQVQRPHRGIKVVAEEIADGCGAEIPKVTPANRIQRGAV